MTPLSATPGQTIGPFFGYALPWPGGPHLVPFAHPEAIRLHGHIRDGAGAPVPDAMVEIWQPDANGRPVAQAGSFPRDEHGFTGWGRAATDRTGHYSFTTVTPGPTVAGRAPFFAITVFARGLLDRLFTRAYVPGYDNVWGDDPLLASLPVQRRATLIAGGEGADLVFDVRLQGERETVFLEYRSRPRPGERP